MTVDKAASEATKLIRKYYIEGRLTNDGTAVDEGVVEITINRMQTRC